MAAKGKKLAYFDCFSGASGDMILGTLIDAGAPLELLAPLPATLGLQGVTLEAEQVTKQGLGATQVNVVCPETHVHRHLHDIVAIIDSADLPATVKSTSRQVFQRLAEAEAKVHRCAVETIHFHEVGAADAIVDIVGGCLALHALGIDQVSCSPLVVGSGTVNCAHGVLPVPAPATAELLNGVPIATSDETGELLTPTGAALLTTWATGFGPPPTMTVDCAGYGAGRREGRQRPNVLRVLLGTVEPATGPTDYIVALEANIDDQSPETTAHTLERLMDQGALDAYCQPIYMKKGRIGTLVTVLCRPADAARLERIMFLESSTLGIRRTGYSRTALSRTTDRVQLPEGAVRIKIGWLDGHPVTVAPEFDDCRDLARAHDQPLKRLMNAAVRAWHDQQR